MSKKHANQKLASDSTSLVNAKPETEKQNVVPNAGIVPQPSPAQPAKRERAKRGNVFSASETASMFTRTMALMSGGISQADAMAQAQREIIDARAKSLDWSAWNAETMNAIAAGLKENGADVALENYWKWLESGSELASKVVESQGKVIASVLASQTAKLPENKRGKVSVVKAHYETDKFGHKYFVPHSVSTIVPSGNGQKGSTRGPRETVGVAVSSDYDLTKLNTNQTKLYNALIAIGPGDDGLYHNKQYRDAYLKAFGTSRTTNFNLCGELPCMVSVTKSDKASVIAGIMQKHAENQKQIDKLATTPPADHMLPEPEKTA